MFVLLSIFLFILQISNQSYSPRHGKPVQSANFLFKAAKAPAKALVDLCPACIEFSEQFINQLLNIILSKYIVCVGLAHLVFSNR